MHEEIWRGTLAEAVQHVEAQEPRGEYALVIEPAPTQAVEITDEVILNELRQRVNNGLSKRDAVDEVTTALGIPRNRAYEISINLQS
jgi:16S rRNA (cytidine1402-2'-O)-methyltransferase